MLLPIPLICYLFSSSWSNLISLRVVVAPDTEGGRKMSRRNKEKALGVIWRIACLIQVARGRKESWSASSLGLMSFLSDPGIPGPIYGSSSL